MALEALVPPFATNLLDPATVLARLKLPNSDLTDVTAVVEEASGLVARYLRFQPGYGLWRETFTGVRGSRLYLGARPVWRVNGMADRNGTDLAGTSFRVDLERSALVRTGGWALDCSDSSWTTDRFSLINLHGPLEAWDWTVEYEAGWWLESMTGSPPAGVGLLAPEVRRDFVAICRWLWGQEVGDPTVKSMRDEGSSVEFFASGDVDAESGIPCKLTVGLAQWRRPL